MFIGSCASRSLHSVPIKNDQILMLICFGKVRHGAQHLPQHALITEGLRFLRDPHSLPHTAVLFESLAVH